MEGIDMDRGFVFTIDAMVGAAIIAFVVLSFTFTVQQPVRESVVLDRMATDALAVLDARGAFDSRDIAAINTTVRETLPSVVSYAFFIEYYNVTAGGGLAIDRNMSVNLVPDNKDIVYASRPVPIFVNETVSSSIKNLTAVAKVRLGVAL
ncbi:MAG: hypothetical protein HY366_01010 [Candidatus Aenigmarchaeota archaeon]|nr:hypothetical protein [Candidatus Aenigmarchaeota archaeon]